MRNYKFKLSLTNLKTHLKNYVVIRGGATLDQGVSSDTLLWENYIEYRGQKLVFLNIIYNKSEMFNLVVKGFQKFFKFVCSCPADFLIIFLFSYYDH